MNSKRFWLFGLGAACVACCTLPLIGGAALGAGAAGLGFGSIWAGLGLLAVGMIAAGAMVLRRDRAIQSCAAAAGCGCKAPAESSNTAKLEAPPIACTLTGDDFTQRTASIRRLAAEHLIAVSRKPLSLQLTYAKAAAAQVQDMVRKERACCAFLEFELRQTSESINLTVTAPEQAREAVDLLFDHFAPQAMHDMSKRQLEIAG